LATLRQIIREIDRQSRFLLKKYGLTAPQLIILKELQRKQEITVSKLARTVSMSQATATNIIDRLEMRRLVTKQRSSQDRRRVLVGLTDGSREILKSNPQVLQERFLREFHKLQEWEQTQILSSLQRIASMMNAEEVEVVPHLVIDPMEEADFAHTPK
jgi:DNA-binding MarR family transcriptional regulator